MLRAQTTKMVAAMLMISAVARGATLSVGSVSMPPGSTVNVTVSGSIMAESTYGLTIQLELVPQVGTTGTVTFSIAPPTDVAQAGDPWPGAGTFSAFDTDVTGSNLLNGTVDDNGTFVPAAVTFSGALSSFPVTASGTASGVWDVLLATSAGNSGWEGLTTSLFAGTITVTASACLINADCADGNACTDDLCTAGICSNPNNTVACDDGDLCTTGDVCSGGSCAGTPVNCSAFSNTCNIGTCNPGSGLCQATPTNEGGTCSDGLLCTTGDVCGSGICAGTPVDCTSFNNQCNIGTCNTGTGLCQATPANKGGPCNDGDLCTNSDTCVSGVCVGTPADCSGLNSTCTVGVCNGATGLCQANPSNEGGTCNDSNLCTTTDVCVSGTCTGTPVNCSALNSTCTVGVCNGATGLCQANPSNEGGVCNDNNTCTSSDMCVNGVCIGTPIGGCEPCSTAAECDDGNLCTDDSCHPAGVCLHVNNTASCNDELFCTATDVCSAGACVGTGDPCTGGLLCDESTDACVECLVNADCDDANVCTDDACVSGVCQYANNTFSCNDGLFCTVTDVCNAGVCVGSGGPCTGAQLCNETTDACVDCIVDGDCDDGNVCTTDTCVSGTCQIANNTLPCNDGLFCTATDTCTGGACVGSGFPCGAQFCSEKLGACVDCLGNGDCNDGNFCTTDSCSLGACVFSNNSLSCDDGLFCTASDVCSGGACVGSGDPCLGGLLCDETGDACVECLTNADCDDANPCTDDVCALGVCSNPDNALPCSDGLFCTATDVCSGGVCVGSGDPCTGQLCNEVTNTCVDCLTDGDCNDGNPCTDDLCSGGVCTTLNNSAACDDGLFCTLIDTCAGGVCVGAGTTCPGQLCDESTATCVDCLIDADCDDANPCTTDVCTGGLCSNNNNTDPCDDGLFCTTTDVCSGGTCVGSGDPCTGGQFCNETLDACVTCLVDSDCDDANFCTDDTCLAGGLCQNVDNTNVCNDNDICTITDRCTSGVCLGVPLDCSSLSTACLVGVCNPLDGQCVANTANEGGSCDDGVACTQNDVCAAGVCAGTQVDCSGLVSFCRTAACNPTTGACDPTPTNEGLACNDNDICTSADACTGGFCIGNLLPNCDSCTTVGDCDDTNVCTSDFCHPVGVCFHGNVAGSCDDGNPCTNNDNCSAGVCVGMPIPGCMNCTVAADCDDGSPCTTDDCVGGACQHTNVEGVACDDGNICTSTDACSGGTCAGVPIPGCDQCMVDADCNDGNVCTTDTCHPVGVCIYSDNTVPCDDGVACTQNDMCNNGACAGSPTPDGGGCDDGSVCTANDLCNGGVCSGSPANDGASCNDGVLCTVSDVCAGGICAGSPLNCTALDNACNVGVCVEATGTCVASPTNEGGACDDGIPCTVNDSCTAGTCSGSTTDCSFLTTTCTIGTCNATTGVCEAIATNEGGACDDGSVCTTVDTCQNGVCTGPGPDCSSFNDVCTVGVCNAISGLCEAGPANDGGACDDGLICTTSDQCAGGVCTGTPVDCSGVGNICALGVCNPSTGSCETTPSNEGGACNDGSLCTTGDVCVSGVCTGTPLDCSSLTVGCLQGVCNSSTGLCEQVPVPNGGTCNDGNLCSTNDTCTGGVCSGTPTDCSSLTNTCNIGTCNTGTGLCQATPANQGGACNDGNLCTLTDTCNSGVCAGTPRNCSSLSDQCNVGTCNLASGTCQKIPANQGGACNDGYACTINDVCFNGVCDGTSTQPEVVNLTFTPSTQTVRIGDTVQVTLVATSATCFPQDVGSIQSILNWDETRLSLVGRVDTGPYSWVYSGFPNDASLDGLNAPYLKTPGNDGDAVYLALASFVDGAEVPPSTGLVVTTFAFTALAVASPTQVVVPASAGSFTSSEVLGQGSNLDITGSLGSANITIVECTSNADCNDGNACTTDSCNVAGNCVHASNTLPCNDSQFCTLTDICSGGTCVGAGDRCPGQFCNESTDACVQCLVDSHCDDANLCTTDTCNSGVCVHANNSLPCNDGLFCTPVDVCISGFCTGTGIACPGQFCNEATDSCVECLNNGNCNDGNVCTTDSCNASNMCVHVNNSAPCDDNQFCTPTDACSGGVCVGTGMACAVNQFCNESIDACVQCLNNSHCSDANVCTDDVCLGGVCSNPNNTLACEDGLFCTAGDTCSGGTCFGGVINPCPGQLCDEAADICVDCFVDIDCIDGLSCTSEVCVGGECVYTPNDAACDDGLFCSGIESCQLGIGCVSSGNPCDSAALCDEPGDFCRCPSPAVIAVGSRHIRITPQPGVTPVAFRVDSTDADLTCLPKYADVDGTLSDTPVFQTPATWGVFSVSDTYIEPSSAYSVEADCRLVPASDPENLSIAVAVNTTSWADLDGSGVVDIDDLIMLLTAFADGTTGAPDLMPCVPNDLVDIDDLVGLLGAFAGDPYPCPAPCP